MDRRVDKRRFERYGTPCFPVTLLLDSERMEGMLLDIGQGGARIAGINIPVNSKVAVGIMPAVGDPIVYPSHVVNRLTRKNQVCLAFEEVLPRDTIDAFMGPTDEFSPPDDEAAYTLARADRERLGQELHDVRSCRSTMFTATITGLLLAITSVLVQQGPRNDTVRLLISIIAVAIFGIGAMATAEKAKALNMREGLLVVLTPYLARKRAPRRYKGWQQLRMCFPECAARRTAGVCMRKQKGIKRSCLQVGESKAAYINAAKRLTPNLLHSFTAFSSCIYFGLYAAITTFLAYSIAQMFAHPWGVSPIRTCAPLVAGILMALILRLNKRYLVIITLLELLLLFFLPFFKPVTLLHQLAEIAAVFLGGTLLSSLGLYLLACLHANRVGEHSIDTYIHAWRAVLDHCVPVPTDPERLPLPTHARWQQALEMLFRRVVDQHSPYWARHCAEPQRSPDSKRDVWDLLTMHWPPVFGQWIGKQCLHLAACARDLLCRAQD